MAIVESNNPLQQLLATEESHQLDILEDLNNKCEAYFSTQFDLGFGRYPQFLSSQQLKGLVGILLQVVYNAWTQRLVHRQRIYFYATNVASLLIGRQKFSDQEITKDRVVGLLEAMREGCTLVKKTGAMVLVYAAVMSSMSKYIYEIPDSIDIILSLFDATPDKLLDEISVEELKFQITAINRGSIVSNAEMAMYSYAPRFIGLVKETGAMAIEALCIAAAEDEEIKKNLTMHPTLVKKLINILQTEIPQTNLDSTIYFNTSRCILCLTSGGPTSESLLHLSSMNLEVGLIALFITSVGRARFLKVDEEEQDEEERNNCEVALFFGNILANLSYTSASSQRMMQSSQFEVLLNCLKTLLSCPDSRYKLGGTSAQGYFVPTNFARPIKYAAIILFKNFIQNGYKLDDQKLQKIINQEAEEEADAIFEVGQDSSKLKSSDYNSDKEALYMYQTAVELTSDEGKRAHFLDTIQQLQSIASEITSQMEGLSINDQKCASCGKNDNLKKCSRCKEVSYCGRECQKADWSSHKANCSQK